MALPQFDIVFRGVREDFDAAQVKVQFANLFKLEAARVDRIFNAKKVTIKTNVSELLADKYIKRLGAIGVLVDKLPVASQAFIPQLPAESKAIYVKDYGAEDGGSAAMHQPVEFVYGEHIRRIPFVFSGSGFGYAKIWLVNLLVCLFSAGILLPWAQARSRRYFYHHTSLDGLEFEYTAQLNKTLLVQIVLTAYLVNLVYSFFYSPQYLVLGIAMLLGLLPLFIVKLNQFHLSYSSYREIRLYDNSSVLDAYIAFLFLPLLIIATAGLAAPWAAFKIQQYLVRSKSFGQFALTFKSHWTFYLPLLPPVLVADFLSFSLFYWSRLIPFYVAALILVAAWLMVFIRWQVILINTKWNATTCSLGYFVSSWNLQTYNNLLMRNIAFCMLSVGLYWPWAKIDIARYRSRHLAFFSNLAFKKWQYSLNAAHQ